MFVFERVGLEKRLWQCSHRRSDKCNARIHTSDSVLNPTFIRDLGDHNHRADAIACEAKQILTNIQTEATSSTDQPAQIIARNVAQTPAAAQGALPLVRSMKRGIRRLRTVAGGSLAVPHRREDIQLPGPYRTTAVGADFLLFDSGPDADRILVFSTKQNLEFLMMSDLWLFDGTFKVSPTLFDQMFVIHAWRNGTTFPLVYCLTPNRRTPTYLRILNALNDLQPGLAPTTIMSDFEKASNNAFSEMFPAAENKGFFFHFSQCFYRHVQADADINHLYSTDSNFALKLWHLVALAFVPPSRCCCYL